MATSHIGWSRERYAVQPEEYDTRESDGGLEAACSFSEKVSRQHKYLGVKFNVVSFEEAMAESCRAPLGQRKALLLYLHNENEVFSEIFFRNLRKPDVEDLLESSFYLLGWDVENSDHHHNLKEAVKEYDFHCLVSLIVDFKLCAMILIHNIDGVIVFNNSQMGKISDSEFFTTLDNVSKFLRINKCVKSQNLLEKTGKPKCYIVGDNNVVDSKKFQQDMADRLGDRDFDCFEYDQHAELKKKIAVSLFGLPEEETGHGNKEMQKANEIYKFIIKRNNKISRYTDRVEMAIIFNCIEPLQAEKKSRARQHHNYNPKADFMRIPIFVLRKCQGSKNPCRIFIDHTGRVYQSWTAYIKENKLPECWMVVPCNGRYEVDQQGKVMLEYHSSPACDPDEKILKGVDIASSGISLASGGLLIAASIPAVAIAPALLVTAGVAGIGTGAYAVGRSIHTLVDRSKHEQSISLENAESRAAYLNIGAGLFNVVGAGTNVAVSRLAEKGVNIGGKVGAVVDTIGIANIAVSGASVLNTGYDVLDRWINENETPSMLTIVQLSSSILFFGNAVYNFKRCSMIVDEAQTRTLKNYQDSLKNNRHRQTFENLMEETIRQSNGNSAEGRAEVISAIRNISNTKEAFAKLTKTRETFTRNGIPFYARGGKILVNGSEIDLGQFAGSTPKDVGAFLSNIPVKKTASFSCMFAMKGLLANLCLPDGAIVQYAVRLLGSFDGNVRKLVLKAVKQLATALSDRVNKLLKEIFPDHRKWLNLLNVAMKFFASRAIDQQTKYDQWKNLGSFKHYEPWYGDLGTKNEPDRCAWFFQKAVKVCFAGENMSEAAFKELLNFFYNWLAREVNDHMLKKESEKKRRDHSAGSYRKRVDCPECKGYFYKL